MRDLEGQVRQRRGEDLGSGGVDVPGLQRLVGLPEQAVQDDRPVHGLRRGDPGPPEPHRELVAGDARLRRRRPGER
nr:hypothetical protein [Cellulomonas hominis]